jgi:hypothetical protein
VSPSNVHSRVDFAVGRPEWWPPCNRHFFVRLVYRSMCETDPTPALVLFWPSVCVVLLLASIVAPADTAISGVTMQTEQSITSEWRIRVMRGGRCLSPDDLQLDWKGLAHGEAHGWRLTSPGIVAVPRRRAGRTI